MLYIEMIKKDDKIKESNFSIVNSSNQNELSSLKPRKNSEIYIMIPKQINLLLN